MSRFVTTALVYAKNLQLGDKVVLSNNEVWTIKEIVSASQSNKIILYVHNGEKDLVEPFRYTRNSLVTVVV